MSNAVTGNILMVSNYPSDTAYAWWLMEHFWVILAQKCNNRKAKAYLAYPHIEILSQKIESAPIETVELCIPWKSAEQKKHALTFIKKHNIQALYFTDQKYVHRQYAEYRIAGVKRIVVHDHTPGDRDPVNGLKGFLKSIRNFLPWITADKVFCVSELMSYRNQSNGRIPANKCIVVQNGIPPIDGNLRTNPQLRAQLGIDDNTLIVITTGRANPYKRFDFVIDCAAELKRQKPASNVVFVLVGDGPAMEYLQTQVKKLNLEKSVHLLGFRSDIYELLHCADIAFHAALGEGFSLSIIEYMSASLPVMVPDIPSVKQALTHNKTGIIYPENDKNSVVNNIIALSDNVEKRLSMGKEAKIAADKKYNLDQCSRAFEAAIESSFFN